MAVITDPKQINELLTRGVEKIYPSRELLEKELLSGRRLRLYGGFDPSAPSLHIGNAVLINKLAQFQALGHEVIFLIGDFTGMIGDPTDKKAARKKLTRDDVTANAANYQKQASAYLKFTGENKAIIKRNSKWQDKTTFKDLIEIASNFTVQQMIIRDMFQERLKEERPIYLHEFLYPLAQAYDSLVLDVDLEVGGNDQMFNMMAGRDLLKAVKGKEKFVITTKLITDDQGKKMGKSEGNAVFLDQEPKNIYGAVMSWPDGVIGVAFELCTKVPTPEVDVIKNKLQDPNINPRDLKMRLAFEITKLVHGAKKAKEAQDYFVQTVQHKEAPEDMEVISLGAESGELLEILKKCLPETSNSEIRRLLEQGAIKVEGEVKKDQEEILEIGDDGLVIKIGKKKWVRVRK